MNAFHRFALGLLPLLGTTGCVPGCRVVPSQDDTAGTPTETAVDSAGETGQDSGPADGGAGDGGGTDTGQPTGHACGTGSPDGWQPPVHTVVVLVTDGARIDETLGDLTSSVNGEATADFWTDIRANLLPQGTEVLPGYATGATITAEGHAEMLTGRRIPQANFPSDWGAGLYRPEFTTLFEAVRKARGTDEDAVELVSNTIHLCGHAWGLDPDHGEDVGGVFDFITDEDGLPLDDDVGVIEAVQASMADHDVNFVLANLHQIDRSGHYNTNPNAYAENVKRVDTPISDFWNWIQSTPPYADDTVLVVVADHGRHRWGTEEDWRNHGDHCVGCRQIPMFLIGPGVRAGASVDTAVTLQDLGATLGWLLGVDLPEATGQVACELLDNPPDDRGRSGTQFAARSGDLLAVQEWLDDPWEKSRILVDGEALSTDGAVHAEAPAVIRGVDQDLACWRELSFAPAPFDTIGEWAWRGRCAQRGKDGAWTDVGFPVSPVQPYFRPSLAVDSGGRFWLAFADNPNGNWEAPEQVLRVLRKTQNGDWEGADEGQATMALPLHPSLVVKDDTAYVAITTSEEQVDAAAKKKGRYTRHIEVYRVEWPVGRSQSWTRVFRTTTAFEDAGDTGMLSADFPWGRMTRPALAFVGDTLALAFVAHGAEGATVAWATSEDGGETWSPPEAVDASRRVYGHVTPAWDGDGWLYWARSGDGGPEVCRARADSPDPSCVSVAGTAVEDLVVGTGGVAVTARDADGAWSLVDLSWTR